MKYLYLLYFRYYKTQERIGNNDVAPFSAMLIIAFILMLYYFDFFIFLSVLLPESSPNLSWKFNIILLLSIIVMLYFILIFKKKYKRILIVQKEIYSQKGKLLSILFPLVAVALLIGGFILKILQNQGQL